ncbi:DNA-binding transcriptional LysR family regulator [Variovorax boronicumulans]|nr:DNA-binding transcriptional LysR family regulator [Variovorax boronicumulans]
MRGGSEPSSRSCATDTQVQRVLPQLKIPPLPVWLAVHPEIRTDRRIRAVYDFLARNIPASI